MISPLLVLFEIIRRTAFTGQCKRDKFKKYYNCGRGIRRLTNRGMYYRPE